MWFWPVNEMTELVSGMPAPQFGDESSFVRGSDLVQGSSGSCVFAYPRGYAYSILNTTSLGNRWSGLSVRPKYVYRWDSTAVPPVSCGKIARKCHVSQSDTGRPNEHVTVMRCCGRGERVVWRTCSGSRVLREASRSELTRDRWKVRETREATPEMEFALLGFCQWLMLPW
jgi:hypothetical protein